MRKIKVLLVDDSAVIRKVLGDLLSQDPSLEVVGTAANGKIALEKLSSLDADVVTLDIEMPEMNGLETVRQIRQQGNSIPIIMCSSLTAEGASYTLDALALGASDYVTKPSSHGANTRDVIGAELVAKIKALAGNAREASPRGASTVRSHVATVAPQAEIVAFGVSTGGPNALMDLLPRLPSDFPVPLVIVQHMPPLFTKLLADRLSDASQLAVVEAQHAQEIKAGCVYLAPGGRHMEIKRSLGRMVVALHDSAPENSCRPAVDVLFRSIAKAYGNRALGVVLTGMGHDGLKGCHAIKEMGGAIIIQDRETSAVWGMPGAVAEAGLDVCVLPLSGIAEEVSRRVFKRSHAIKGKVSQERVNPTPS